MEAEDRGQIAFYQNQKHVFLTVQGWNRDLHVLGKCSTTELYPSHKIWDLGVSVGRQRLTMYRSLALNPQLSCLCLPRTGTAGLHHHTWPAIGKIRAGALAIRKYFCQCRQERISQAGGMKWRP